MSEGPRSRERRRPRPKFVFIFVVRLPGLPEAHWDDSFALSGPGLSVRACAGTLDKTGPVSYRIRFICPTESRPTPG